MLNTPIVAPQNEQIQHVLPGGSSGISRGMENGPSSPKHPNLNLQFSHVFPPS